MHAGDLFTDDERRSLIYLLIEMAEADHVFRIQEEQFIVNVAHQFGLTKLEVDSLRHGARPKELVFPKHEERRIIFIYHVMYLMRVDGEIQEEEKLMMHKLGFRLGMVPTLIDELILLSEKYTDKAVPSNELIDTLRKHLN